MQRSFTNWWTYTAQGEIAEQLLILHADTQVADRIAIVGVQMATMLEMILLDEVLLKKIPLSKVHNENHRLLSVYSTLISSGWCAHF